MHSLSRSPNFGYAPIKKLKINHNFREMMHCCRRIHAVLLLYHLLILVEIVFFFFVVTGIPSSVFDFFVSSIILDPYGTNFTYARNTHDSLHSRPHRNKPCHKRISVKKQTLDTRDRTTIAIWNTAWYAWWTQILGEDLVVEDNNQ